MSLKTETDLVFHPHGEPEDFFSHKLLRMLSALGVATIVLSVYLTWHPVSQDQLAALTGGASNTTANLWGIFPWRIAAGWTVAQGTTEFGTGLTPQLDNSMRNAALLSMLFLFVIVPCVFMFAWRGYHLHDHHQHALEEELKTGPSAILPIGYGIGVTLLVMLCLPLISITLNSAIEKRRMEKALASISERDALVGDVNIVFCDAYQYWVLPQGMQGGGRSFEHYQIPPVIRHNKGRTYSTVIATDNILKVQGYSGTGETFILATISSDGTLSFSTQGL